jgi:poly(ADP-ribose) glycohydrolase ARH3
VVVLKLTEALSQALLLGVALGDALGRPLEVEAAKPADSWLEPGSIELRGINVGGRFAYSDDTETTLILAKSIAGSCGFNPHHFAHLLAREANVEDPIRGYGVAVATVVLGLRRGLPWWSVARSLYGGQGSMGNGAAVRVSPVAIYYHGSRLVESMAIAQALVTHTNPVAVEGARLLALAYEMLINGLDVDELITRLASITELSVYRVKLGKILSLPRSVSPRDAVRYIGNTSIAYESIPAALLALARGDCDPNLTLHRALSLGGDADSIASMAVGLAVACSGGLKELSSLAKLVEGYDAIRDVASRLYMARNHCGGSRIQAS